MYASLKMEDILTHLSERVVEILKTGGSLQHLIYLLEFLAAWAQRPAGLAPLAYQWCSVIADAAKELQADGGTNTRQARQRLRLQDPEIAERGFDNVGPGFDPFRQNSSPSGSPTNAVLSDYTHLLSIALEIGFTNDNDNDHGGAGGGRPHPRRRPHHHDAVRPQREDTEHSSGLRQVAISTIERVGLGESVDPGLGIAQVLNHLNIDEDDVADKSGWATLLVKVIRSPQGAEDLSSHCWHLLDRWMLTGNLTVSPAKGDLKVVESLKGAGKWEELGVWMVIMWSSPTESSIPDTELMERIEEATRELLLHQPSVLQRYENLSESGQLHRSCKVKLGRICEQAKQVPLTPP